MHRADLAMYRAKEAKATVYQMYSEDLVGSTGH
jgi:hypothetical protein